MANPRVKMNSHGARTLLLSDEVEADLLARAERIRDATGMPADADGFGYFANSIKGRNRARASVITRGYEAMKDNSTRQTLLQNLDKGR